MEDLSRNLSEIMNRRHLNQRFDDLMTQVRQDPEVQQFLQVHQAELAPDALTRSAAKLYEFVQERQKLQRHETTLAPGYEPQLIVNQHYVDVTYVPTEKLVAQRQAAALKNRVQAISMPKNIRSARLDQFYPENRVTALRLAADFVQAYVQKPKSFHQGLYLYGSFGVGKTYLLGAIANELATYGFQSTLVHFPSFTVEMKGAIGENNLTEKLAAIKQAPILMLDDIGADSISSWSRDDILGVILQYRMQEELATFFSSNFSMQQLEQEHLTVTRGASEPLKAKRIMERIRFLSQEVKLVGRNRRQAP